MQAQQNPKETEGEFFTSADLFDPEKSSAIVKKAKEVGAKRGYLLGKVIKASTDMFTKERASKEAQDDVVTIFIWQSFKEPDGSRFPVNSPQAKNLKDQLFTKAPWFIDALYGGMNDGLKEAAEDKEAPTIRV